jgi:molybdenum cofactor cytidylyltransferase
MENLSRAPLQVGGIVLAAGKSERFGGDKQLALFKGHPLLFIAAMALKDSGAEPIAGILRPGAFKHREILDRAGIACIVNEHAAKGMATSVIAGIANPKLHNVDALLMTACDQPLVTGTHLRVMVNKWRSTRPIALAAKYSGTIGVPAIFSAALFPQLAALEGDRGAGSLLRSLPEIATFDLPEAACDIDNPDRLRQLESRR